MLGTTYYCGFNYTYSSSGCFSKVYLPLSLTTNNRVNLPLHYGGVTNQATNTDFTLGFWILLKDN